MSVHKHAFQNENRRRTAKERLHHESLEPRLLSRHQDEPTDVDHALPIDEHLDLAVRLPDVVQPHALREIRALARRPGERPAPDRRAVHVVARRERRDVALHLVRRVRGQVRVQLAHELLAPHHARGEAVLGAFAARAPGRVALGVPADCTRDTRSAPRWMSRRSRRIRTEAEELAAQHGVEAVGDVERVAHDGLFRIRDVHFFWAQGVRGKPALGMFRGDVRARGVDYLHRLHAVWGSDVFGLERSDLVEEVERRVLKRVRVVREALGRRPVRGCVHGEEHVEQVVACDVALHGNRDGRREEGQGGDGGTE